MRVLIVDDCAAVRTAVRSTLDGYSQLEIVGEAGNGEEALEQTAKMQPDLIIMDISMPVLDGLTAAQIIKRFHPQTRILLFSTHKVGDFITAARNLGLCGYVAK